MTAREEDVGGDPSTAVSPFLFPYPSPFQCSQHLEYAAIQTLSWIALWVVRCCSQVTFSRQFLQCLEQFIVKFTPLVMIQLGGIPKPRYKVTENQLSGRFSTFVLCGICLSISSEMIKHHQNIFIASTTCFQMQIVNAHKF